MGKLTSYCNDCAQGIDDFPISNPWSLGKRGTTKPVNESAPLETCEAEMKAEAAATDKTVSESLAHDDMRRLNSTHSAPAESDLMGRSVQLEHVAAKSAASQRCGQALEATSEIAEKPVAVHSGNAGTTGSSSPGEEKQRAKLLKFLNAPASQGMRPRMRQAGRHWAEGFSQNDVARKLNMDPSIVRETMKGGPVAFAGSWGVRESEIGTEVLLTNATLLLYRFINWRQVR